VFAQKPRQNCGNGDRQMIVPLSARETGLCLRSTRGPARSRTGL